MTATPPLPRVTEDDITRNELRDSCQVALTDANSIACVVSFQPGKERHVYLIVDGIPDAVRPFDDADYDPAAVDTTQLLHRSPVMILADPDPSRPGTGVVLSVAPLLGAKPSVTANHPRWLELHVRPAVRSLLKYLRLSSTSVQGLAALAGRMRDGKWVLSFHDPRMAVYAQ